MLDESKVSVSVIIPAFNEGALLYVTLTEIEAYCRGHFKLFEIIVVDDGSVDNTALEAERVKNVTVIRLPQNRGKGFAVKTGVQKARYDYILFMDADNSTSIEELPAFLQAAQNADIVIGSRALFNSKVILAQNYVKRTIGRMGNLCIKTLLGLPVHDTQCGFKLFTSQAKYIFELQTLDRWGFDFELLFIAKTNRLTISELPVRWVNRAQSRVKAFDYVRVLGEVVLVRFRGFRGMYNMRQT